MPIYILKSTLCLCILLAFYKIGLESLSNHKFKRFYLLSILPLAIGIPLITFTTYVEPTLDFGTYNPNNFITPSSIPAEVITEEKSFWNYLPTILWSIYGIGVAIFLSKFCVNLYAIFSKIKKHQKIKNHSFINVLIKQLQVPHTFFYYIFLNKKAYNNHQIPSEVLLHEQTHAKQLHSIDILLIELFQIVFWFNPFIIIYKKSIKLNHEFLADAEVLDQGVSKTNYQNILLAYSSYATQQHLANAINYSSIKKRFTVMKTQSSKKSIWIRSLLLLPLLAILLFSFTNQKEVIIEEEDQTYSNTTKEKNSDTKSIYYKNATFKFLDKNKNIIATKKYDELTNAEKSRLLPPPSKPIKKKPSAQQLSNWLDTKNYGIWIDGKRIENNTLKNYNSNDFGNFYVSKLEKNAINYGKHYYQVNLYTLQEFTRLIKNHGEPLDKGTVITITQNSELEQESSNTVKSIKYTKNKTSKQKGLTQLEISEYNKLARKFSTKKDSKNITIKRKDHLRIKYLYDLMTKEQREYVEPYPNIPPPPTVKEIKPVKNNKKPEVVEIKLVPPPPPPVPANATEAEKIKYKKAIENYKKGKPGKIKKVKNDNDEWIEVVEIIEANAQEVPPPPPPPKSPLDHIINMAKKNATFYFEGKKITSDEAIKLLKTDKNLNIATQKQNSNAPKVHISTQPITTNKEGKLVTKPISLKEVKSKINENDQGYVTINNETYFYIIDNEVIKYFNRWGEKVDEKGNILSSNKNYKSTAKVSSVSYSDKNESNHLNQTVTVNNKKVIDGMLTLTKEDIEVITLNSGKNKIVSFKLKVQGQSTKSISGKSINLKNHGCYSPALKKKSIQIFDIKDAEGNKYPPIFISIKN
ncbi:M56 family metallopeptidase [Pontimicrobium sp. IMCC45349]|uniref:M56 family metallopeptidase n=1 Tax=Pontimicrobium sp. IMCC45349 TaxID=3391574 RepID=UPI0039A32C81